MSAVNFVIPKNLRGVVVDIPTIFLTTVLNLITFYVALSLLAGTESEKDLFSLIILFLFGWGPMFMLANLLTGLPAADTFLDKKEAYMLGKSIIIGLAAMVLLAFLVDVTASKLVIISALGLSTTGTVTYYFVISAAINEEWAMANLQRVLTLGQDNEFVVLSTVFVRGIIFALMHRPYAYAGAPFAFIFSLFLSGVVLGLVFIWTKRFSIVIICHIIWNVLAVS